MASLSIDECTAHADSGQLVRLKHVNPGDLARESLVLMTTEDGSEVWSSVIPLKSSTLESTMSLAVGQRAVLARIRNGAVNHGLRVNLAAGSGPQLSAGNNKIILRRLKEDIAQSTWNNPQQFFGFLGVNFASIRC